MFSDDPKITQYHSATFREFILLPRQTLPENALPIVSLGTRLAEDFPLAIPFMSAAMESVTGDQMAIALALHGGLGVLPAGRIEAEDQVRQIEAVKAYRDGWVTDFESVGPASSLRDVDDLERRFGFTTFPVLDEEGRLLGEISTRDYHPGRDLDKKVTERIRPNAELMIYPDAQPFDEVMEMLYTSAFNRAYVVDDKGVLQTLVFRKGLKRERRFTKALRDKQGRLKVAAAISTHPEDRDRARDCVAAGVDLLSIDASDGYSEYMGETIKAVKRWNIPVVAGNVVSREGFEYLAECGADAVKIGIGSGSICTTRRVKAIGRGQATAVRQVAMARDAWAKKTGKYIPLVSDGGLSGTGDMSVALAMGADVLMMGKYFAGFHESPTKPVSRKLRAEGNVLIEVTVKPYWGEASARAKNVRRYQQNDPRTFVIEGEEGFVLSKGSMHEKMPIDLKAIKGTLSSCGCTDLEQFRREVMLEKQTVGSQQEGGTSVMLG
jgi:IMP dehydrogenase